MNLIHTRADEGDSHIIVDHLVTSKLKAAQTNNTYAVGEIRVPPQAGPPLHKHEPQETFYILEGAFEFTTDTDTLIAQKGDLIHVPSNVPHTFKNISEQEGRILGFLSPVGMEQFFERVGVPYKGQPLTAKKPSLWQMLKFGLAAKRYGISFVKPKK